MTESGTASEAADAYLDYPANLYRAKEPSRLRQGDLCYGVIHQLRTSKDNPGPGDESASTLKVPFFGEPLADEQLKIGQRNYQLRAWAAWLMILNQGCELSRPDPDDSRILVAPIVFRSKWPSDDRWRQIREGSAPGFVFLPPMRENDMSRTQNPRGWPEEVEAAAVLSSVTTVGRRVLDEVAFGLSSEMQHILQRQIVSYFSVRDWKSFKQRDEVLNKEILAISETDETTDGPAKLYKVHLAEPGGQSGDDEITVGMLFRRK